METTVPIDLLSRGEGSRHQFKENFTNADALAAVTVAFSNTAGGKIFIGVRNEGSVLPQQYCHRAAGRRTPRRVSG